jgi:hypothetical protein
MSKEALFVGLQIRTDESLGKLLGTMELFQDSHKDIVQGVGSISEMPELTDMCTLLNMKAVSGEWNNLQPKISEILDQRTATDAGLIDVGIYNMRVLNQMNAALQAYTGIGSNVCDPQASMNEESWMNAMTEMGRQRMLTQSAISLFFQLVKGVNMLTARQSLDTALVQAASSLRLLIEGDTYLNLPSPPLQAIVNQLMVVSGYWNNFVSRASSDLREANLLAVDLTRFAQAGENAGLAMNGVAALYVEDSLKTKERRSVMVEIAWQQLTILQKMSKEALLISLGKSVVPTTALYVKSIAIFESQHQELLDGRVATSPRRLGGHLMVEKLFADKGFPPTKDACTLTALAKTLKYFEQMKAQFQLVVDARGDATVEMELTDELNLLTSAIAARDLADAELKKAADAKEEGTSSCNTILTKSEWESGLQLSGKPAQYLREAQKNFFLIASGLAGIWKAESDSALATQLASISDDTESPLLETVISEFTAGWMTMGQSDLDRAAALTNSYVTQNPNPVGSKQLYDVAPGAQAYHASHKMHHPSFRETLATKNYDDLVVFDTRGNVVYTRQ